MKRLAIFPVTALAIVALMVLAGRLPADRRPSYVDDYNEECLHEGCSGEEVEELHESYDEECFGEGCSQEEVVELAGTPEVVNAMLDDFAARGLKVSPEHRCDAKCIDEHRCTFTSCKGFVQTCCGTGKKRGWCVGIWSCPPER
jgi:hypothetical protein